MPNRRLISAVGLGLAAVLLAGAGAPAAGQFPAPGQFLPGDDAIGPAAGDQLAPAIGRGGDLLLAAWADKRSNPDGLSYEFETSSDIYGMLLDAAGNPVTEVPFVISQVPGTQENPQVVWNGTHWLVVFESYDISGTGYYYEKSLAAVRVTPLGEVVDAKPIKIFNVIPFAGSWAVTSDGTDWMLAFQGNASTTNLMAMRIAADGTVEQPPKSLVTSDWYSRYNLRLAFAGGVYLLTWDDLYDGQAIRFDQSLTVLDPAPITLVSNSDILGLDSNGSQFYIVWHQQQPNYTIAVTGSRVGTDGVKLDGSGDNISGNNEPQAYTTTRAVWDGTYWRVTWGFSNAVRVARVDAAGTVVDPGGVAVSGPATGPTAGAPGGGVQIVWNAYTGYQNDVLAANVAADNTAGPNVTLSIGAPLQHRADVAAGSDGYMVVFRSDTASAHRVMAQPLDADGIPLTAEPIELDIGDILYGPGTPSVGWNGSLYLATWSNASGIVAQRLEPDGTPVDAVPFFVMPGFGPTDVAALGDTFLVVGRKYGYTVQIIDPVAARVRGSDGAVLDPGGKVLGWSYATSIATATLGTRWLVVWQRNFTHDDPLADTMGAFVEADGTALGQFTIYSYYSTAGGNGLFELTLAANDEVALMVQSHELSSGVETDLVSRMVNADGSLRPAVNLTPWIGNQYRPKAAWDGSRFIVVYNEQRNRFAPWTLDQLDARSDLFGMRIAADGAILDPLGFAFSASPFAEARPNVVAAGGVSLVSGSLLLGEPFAAYRVGYERLGVGGNQWPVAAASASASGGDVPLAVDFDSFGSDDLDGTVVSSLWDFGDGQTSTEPAPSHTYTTPGNYVATLTVTDDGGSQTANTWPVAATSPNQPPVAVASADKTSGDPPLDVTFYAVGSYDPDGGIGNHEWTFSDGGSYWGSTAYHTFYTAGTHTATLKVYDNRGGTGTATLTITVGGGGVPPAPSNLTAVGKSKIIGGNTKVFVQLTWKDNSTNETGFEIERCTGAGCTNFARIRTVAANTTRYNDKTVAGATTYSYRVRATSSAGPSGYSNTATVTTP